VAFFAGLTENFGPVTEHTDIVFDRVITNIGGGYEQKTGRFTAPYDGVYQFNVIVSAQGRQKVESQSASEDRISRDFWREHKFFMPPLFNAPLRVYLRNLSRIWTQKLE